MFNDEQAKPGPSGPPCVVCGGEYHWPAWGFPLCAWCAKDWSASDECAQVQLQLDPIPLWQLARMEAKDRPPEPNREMRNAAYKRAVSGWIQRVMREREAA